MTQDLKESKEYLIKKLKMHGYISSQEVENAFRKVPREEFLPPHLREHAYLDTPLRIGRGQTISAPHMCAIMCELLKLQPGLKMLEIGTGSGYHAALCAELLTSTDESSNGFIFTIERIPELAMQAEETLRRLGYEDRVKVIIGDGSLGYPDEAPYDRILVTAAAPKIPPPLLDQLAPLGRLVIPVGEHLFWQELIVVEKDIDGNISKSYHGGVAFVPLVGKFGVKD